MEPREYTWSQLWNGIDAIVQVDVEDPSHGEGGLTFGLWTSCLIAINRFRLAYPGVFTSFNILVKSESLLSHNVGHGRLDSRQWNSATGTNLTGAVNASE